MYKDNQSKKIILDYLKSKNVSDAQMFTMFVNRIGKDSFEPSLRLTKIGVNVLEDDEIRQGIKQYSDWPTIPQLYVKKKFIGGCDIVKEMFETGELQKVLNEK